MPKKTSTKEDINDAIDRLFEQQRPPVCTYDKETNVFNLCNGYENYSRNATCLLTMNMLRDELELDPNPSVTNDYKTQLNELIDCFVSRGGFGPFAKEGEFNAFPDSSKAKTVLATLQKTFTSSVCVEETKVRFRFECLIYWCLHSTRNMLIKPSRMIENFTALDMRNELTQQIQTLLVRFNTTIMYKEDRPQEDLDENNSDEETKDSDDNNLIIMYQTDHHLALSPSHSNENYACCILLCSMAIIEKISSDNEVTITNIMLLIAGAVGLAWIFNTNTSEKIHVAPFTPSERIDSIIDPHAEKDSLKNDLIKTLIEISSKETNSTKKDLLKDLYNNIKSMEFNWGSPSSIHRFSACITLARRVVAHQAFGRSIKTMPPEIKDIEKGFNGLFPESKFKVHEYLTNTNPSESHSTTLFGRKQKEDMITFDRFNRRMFDVFTAIDAINDTFDGALSLEGFNDTSSEEGETDEGRTTSEDLTTSEEEKSDGSDDRDTPSPFDPTTILI